MAAANTDSSLHVTGLPDGCTEDQVTQIFAQHGVVKSVKVLPKRGDKPDIAAIVDMETAEQAQTLIDTVSGTVPAGLTAPLVIKKKLTSWANQAYQAMTAAAAGAESTLHVTGIPEGCSEEQVTQLFTPHGTVKAVKILPKRDDKPNLAAIVEMETAEGADAIIEASQTWATGMVVKKKTTNWAKGWNMYSGKGWGKGGGWGSGGGLRSFAAEKKIWIGGIPEEGVDFKELQAHFPGSKFATVMKGKGAGTGGVAFGTAEEATAAIATLNGSTLGGATIVVDVWTKKEDEPAAETAAA